MWFHAPPVNRKKQGGSRSAPSLLPLVGGGLHGDLQHKKTQKTTQSQLLGSLLSSRSSSSSSSSRRRGCLDDLQNKAKIHKHNATTQHKIDFIFLQISGLFFLSSSSWDGWTTVGKIEGRELVGDVAAVEDDGAQVWRG